MCRRSSSSWIIASRSSPVSSATRPPSPSSTRVVGDASERSSARPMIHASTSARSGPWARVASRRIDPSGSITSTQAASATAGTSRASSRRRASSMSAAPSVIRAASASSSSWRRSVSAAPRARTAASRWRAANTAIAAPAATVTSGTAAFSPNDPCQTGLISDRKKARTPTRPTSRERAPSAIASTGSRYQVRPNWRSPVAMSTTARPASATSPPTSQGTLRRSTAAVYGGAVAPTSIQVLPGGFELPLEPRLPRIGAVDQVALEERAAALAKRSIKKESKVAALLLAVRMIDLTTLEGADTPGKVRALSAKAIQPDPADPSIPSCAAVCVYPNLVPTARAAVAGTGVKVASVATAFPSGQSSLAVKVGDVEEAVAAGADEIDMVIDRGAFLSGRYAKVFDEIVRVKEACGTAHLKVILETGELGTYDNIRRASLLAMAAGADFIKTSTGKLPQAATLPILLCMLEAIRDVHDETGRVVGMKPAGGIRTAKQAIQNLVIVNETLGPDWLTPDRFRLGASSLLNDVLMQIRAQRTGRYQNPEHFTRD